MEKRVRKLRFKIYLLLTLVYLGVGALSLLIFYVLIPQRYFGAYPIIDVFFWICGMALTYFLDRSRTKHPDQLLNVYMMCRGIKFLLLIVFLVVGIRVLEMHRLSFTISLMCNYLVYSGLEIYIYYMFSKRIHNGK